MTSSKPTDGAALLLAAWAQRTPLRAAALARALLAEVLPGGSARLARRGEALARALEAGVDAARDPSIGARFDEWQARVSDVGSILAVSARALGVELTGVRHDVGALRALARSVIGAGAGRPVRVGSSLIERLPDLAPSVAPLWVPPLVVALWLHVQRRSGAALFGCDEVSHGLRLWCRGGGGDACPELSGLPRCAARGHAWVILPAEWLRRPTPSTSAS